MSTLLILLYLNCYLTVYLMTRFEILPFSYTRNIEHQTKEVSELGMSINFESRDPQPLPFDHRCFVTEWQVWYMQLARTNTRQLYRLYVNQRACLFSTSIPRRSATLPKTIRQLVEEKENPNKTPTPNEGVSNSDITSSIGTQDSVIHGWVKSVRKQKHVAFVQLSDGTERESRGLQLVFEDPSLVDGSVASLLSHQLLLIQL
jgi:hypothetical protein